jgi:hypothetical protein
MRKLKLLSFLALVMIALPSLSQDVIINRSGVQWNVNIVREFTDSVHFIFCDDTTRTVKNIDRKYVENVVYEKNYKKLPVDRQTGLITWSGIIELSGKNVTQLLASAKDWLSHPPLSVTMQVVDEDNAEGKIIAKGSFLYIYNNLINHPPGGSVHFTLSLFFKNGKYKYVINEFVHSGIRKIPSVGPLEQTEPPRKENVFETWMFRNNWNRLKIYTEGQINSLVESLEKAMAGRDKGESW